MRTSLLRVFLIGLLFGLLAFLLRQIGWLSGLDTRAYDFALRHRPAQQSPSQVAVIQISDAALSALGRWPWDWSRHAEFVRTLNQHYHPRAIVFDLVFAEADKPAAAKDFADAVSAAGNVYLASYFTTSLEKEAFAESKNLPFLIGKYEGDAAWQGRDFAGVRIPVKELAARTAGLGSVNVFPETDGYIRRMPLVIEFGGKPYISLLGAVANSLLNPAAKPVKVKLGEFVALGDKSLPIDDAGETWISFLPGKDGGPPFPRYYYHEVLARKIPADALKDKVVLVGFGATGLADVHPTPLNPGSLGVDINAYALNGLLQHSFLRPAEWYIPLLLALVFGFFSALTAAYWVPAKSFAFAALLAFASLFAAALLLWQAGIWPGAAAPACAALASCAALVALRYRDSERETLEAQARAATLAQATQVLGSTTHRPDLLTAIRDQITDALAARQTNIYLYDEGTDLLTLTLPPQAKIEPVSYKLGESAVGAAAQQSSIELINAIPAGSQLAAELSQVTRFAPGGVVYAPLFHRGQLLGVMEIIRLQGEAPFESRQIPVIEALASEAAVALQNVTFYEQLEGKIELANRKLIVAYDELKQERDRVSAIVSSMADGVLLSDDQGRLLYINPAAARMFSLSPAEAEGKPIAKILPYEALLEQLSLAPSESAARIPRIRLEAPRRVLSPRTVRLTYGEGQFAGAITVISDITLLEELSEMKTEFVSIVSHELRTPLTSIMGFAQTLQGGGAHLSAEDQTEFLGIIEQESNRLLMMINDLLDMSRMEAGRALSLNFAPVDLAKLAQHVVHFQRVSTSSHEFRFDFPPDGLVVEADKDKVLQIITNLVSNAIKYSPDGGEITVGVKSQDGDAVIYVQDQGLGMTPEESSRLFQRFQRIDRDAIKGIRGTGLGLYLVRALVEAQGGRIWVESESGKGSTFYFSLPKTR